MNGKIYVIGGVTTMDNTTDVAFNGQGPARVLGTNQMYDPATNTWTTKSPMPTGRNHAFSGVVNGKIYVIGGRIGHGFVTTSSNTDVVEEYDPARDLWGVAKARMLSPRSGGGWATYNGKIYVAGGEVQNERYSAAFRSLETYDPAANRWDILPSLPGAVHGNAVAFIGNKLHTVSGKMEGGGFADAPGKATADHSVMEMPAAALNRSVVRGSCVRGSCRNMKRVVAVAFIVLRLGRCRRKRRRRARVDWDKLRPQILEHYRSLVQTRHDRRTRDLASDYLKKVLEAEGIPTSTFALDPNRANLVARLKGNGSKRPLLILAHTDVVGVQREKWPVDPFGAVMKDGYVWGRGSKDDKPVLTANLIAMLMLKRLGSSSIAT